MFGISAKGIYGVSAVLELALRSDEGPVQIREIAEAQDIPQHYLEQILVALKRGGVVKSYRGARGGYSLSDDPSRIRLLDALTILEGPLEVSPAGKGDSRLEGLWHDLAEGAKKRLEMSLADLVEEVRMSGNGQDFTI